MDSEFARNHTKESFSPKLFAIIMTIHLLALPALFSINYSNILLWLLAHVLFGTVGASIGLHRYFSHRSFEFRNSTFKNFVTLLATLCFQGGPVFWAAAHREHHRHSENFGDPHNAKRGFFWSHIGWMFYLNPNGFSYVKSLRVTSDLKKDRSINFFEVYNLEINILFLCLLCSFCQLIGRPETFFWIGPLRIVSVWHSTWLINSYAHGAKFFPSEKTKIKNSNLMALVIGGDGDHLFHHEHPSSIKHSEKVIHLDYGYLLLRLFKAAGLVNFDTNRVVRSQALTKNVS
jgi:fatty-acid desaturase